MRKAPLKSLSADRLFPISIAEWLHERAPQSELRIVPGGSHAFPVMRPDAVAEQIAAFVAE